MTEILEAMKRDAAEIRRVWREFEMVDHPSPYAMGQIVRAPDVERRVVSVIDMTRAGMVRKDIISKLGCTDNQYKHALQLAKQDGRL